jgi:hypothetical protein
MLVLKRREGQWVEITHKSGDVLRFRTYNIRSGYPGALDIAFQDDAHNFRVERPERPRPVTAIKPTSTPLRLPSLPGTPDDPAW